MHLLRNSQPKWKYILREPSVCSIKSTSALKVPHEGLTLLTTILYIKFRIVTVLYDFSIGSR